MLISSLALREIACFKTLDLDFRPGLNLICGPNGIGKSSILDAVAEPFLGVQEGRIRRRALASTGSWSVSMIDNNGEEKTASKSITAFRPSEESTKANSFYNYARNLLYLRTNRDFAYKALSGLPADKVVSDVSASSAARDGIDNADLKGWLAQRWLFSFTPDGGLEAYQKRNLELSLRCFGFLSPEVSFVKAEAGSYDIKVSTPNGEIYFEYLSSGFRSALFILLGIIKEIEVRNLGGASEFNGVVLIDEIDLHLHPTWQQTFLSALKLAFPSAQIIATTHSPHMIQTVKAEEIIALYQSETGLVEVRKFSDMEYGFSGWSVEEILADVMGVDETRSPQFTEAVDNFEEALESGKSKETEKYLIQLETMLHPSSELRKIFRIQAASVLAKNDKVN